MYSSMAAGKVSSSKMQLGNSSRKELSSPLLPVSIYDVHGSLSCANVYLPQPCVSLLRTARCSNLQGEDTHTHTHLGCVVAAKRPSYLNPLSFPLLWSAALSSRNLSFFQKKNKHRRQDLLLYIAREQTPTKKRMEIPSSFSPAREWMHTQKEWMVNNKKKQKTKRRNRGAKNPTDRSGRHV